MPHPNYRQLAFATYPQHCAYCNFGVKEVLEVAHLDHNRSNNDPANLVILCPNCHKMHDLGLIPSEVIVIMRAHPRTVTWTKRMKDAGAKAAATRTKRIKALARKRRAAALKAVATRRIRKRQGRAA